MEFVSGDWNAQDGAAELCSSLDDAAIARFYDWLLC